MTYTTADARQQLLDTLAGAVELLGRALASLSEAYEQLDEATAERLETELFRPVQAAYGRAGRTYAEFVERHRLEGRQFQEALPPAPSRGVRGLVEGAVDSVEQADGALAVLQDSMLPVEVGDPQLRSGLAEIRSLLADTRSRARGLVRVLGR